MKKVTTHALQGHNYFDPLVNNAKSEIKKIGGDGI